jgi:hypothetical protein
MGAKRNILALRRRIEKDAEKEREANAPGGRYYQPTIADQLAAIRSAVIDKGKGLLR